VSVCLSVCLSARMCRQPHGRISLSVLPAVVARSFSDDNAFRYVLPVLWMTSRSDTMVHRQWLGDSGHRLFLYVAFQPSSYRLVVRI